MITIKDIKYHVGHILVVESSTGETFIKWKIIVKAVQTSDRPS